MKLLLMHENTLVSELVIEEKNIRIVNKTNDIFLMPFGRREVVNKEDFELFLASRCIPKSRENVKDFLDKIGLKVHSFLDIIEVTHGWMAEDNLWLKEPSEEITWEEVDKFNRNL